MYRKINKPEGQKELTSFMKRIRSKSVSEVDKKKRTPPSTERPIPKKVNTDPDFPKISGEFVNKVEDRQCTDDTDKLSYEENRSFINMKMDKEIARDKQKEREKELEEKLKMDAERLSKFYQEFREFGMMMNENMRRIQISQENKIEELMQPMKDSLLTLIEVQRDQALQREELQEIKKKHEVLQQKCHQIEQENQDLCIKTYKNAGRKPYHERFKGRPVGAGG